MKSNNNDVIKVLPVDTLALIHEKPFILPLPIAKIPAGFPSPADDYIDHPLNLNDYLIRHPSATFFIRVTGDSMTNAGIFGGDILIVDRAIEPVHNKIVVAIVEGEFTVKRLHFKGNDIWLVPENPEYPPIHINNEMDFEIWGVVTCVIHKV